MAILFDPKLGLARVEGPSLPSRLGSAFVVLDPYFSVGQLQWALQRLIK